MPFADPEMRRAADRARYWRNKEERTRAATLWNAIDFLLALWCVEWKPRIRGLEALWRAIVPVHTVTERSLRQITVRGTRFMVRIAGEDFRTSEYEGTDLLARLQDEKEDFLFGLEFTVYWARRR